MWKTFKKKLKKKTRFFRKEKKSGFSEVASASCTYKCGLCERIGKDEEASYLCRDCDDYLCDNCRKQHSVSKATKEHGVRQLDKQSDNQGDGHDDDEVYFCYLCLAVGRDQTATRYCRDCEMYICDSCHLKHTSVGATKNHNVKSLATKPVEDCKLCIASDVKTVSVYHCKECQFPLCRSCTIKHRRIRSTRNHLIVDGSDRPVSHVEKEEPTSPIVDSEFCTSSMSDFTVDLESNRNSLQSDQEPSTKELVNEPQISINPYHGTMAQRDDDFGRSDDSQPMPTQPLDTKHSPSGHQGATGQNNGQVRREMSPDQYQQVEETKTSTSRPEIFSVTTESVELSWIRPSREEKVDYYEIRYKEVSATKWDTFSTKDERCSAIVIGLKCSTKYHFKVRAVYNDEEGPYTDVSEEVETTPSSAKELLKFAVRQEGRKPVQYKIPITITARNKRAMTRKCLVGQSSGGERSPIEKTIMLIGATGAGKSTLLDGIMNYITNVAFNDDFRFTVVDLVEGEKQKKGNQAESQTEWITYYKVHAMNGGRIDFALNIIDTPGFGDCRGIERDKMLVEQIREFFCTKGDHGVDAIDAVCFVTQAPLARLTPTQRYIFDSIMSVFGKDIASNIVIMITFADGNTPPALAALQAGGVPFKEYFVFNNSALFAQESEKFAPMFWDMGRESFRTFFDHLRGMQTRSLSLTAEVLKERKHLEQTVNGLLPQMDRGLNKMEEIRCHRLLLNQHKLEMNANKNFKFKDKRTRDKRIDLEAGVHVTNCLHCHHTCHFPCQLPNDDQKVGCAAMDSNGRCTVCKNKCFWDQHSNTGYKIVMFEEEYEGTYEDLLKKYSVAKSSIDKTKSLLNNMKVEFSKIGAEVHNLITEINRCLIRLKNIALKPDPLNDVQYIEQLIEAEKMNKKPGFAGRIKSLENIKKQAEVTTKVHKGTFDPFCGFVMGFEDD